MRNHKVRASITVMTPDSEQPICDIALAQVLLQMETAFNGLPTKFRAHITNYVEVEDIDPKMAKAARMRRDLTIERAEAWLETNATKERSATTEYYVIGELLNALRKEIERC